MICLVTGARGFVGSNLCLELSRREGVELRRFDINNTWEELERWIGECDFVFHLAGVNRPKDVGEFAAGNAVFTEDVLELMRRRFARTGCRTPILLSSSIQAALDNPYGKSKLAAEEAVRKYGRETGAPTFIFRLANVFGKWCRPNYNSAVATWCHNIAHDLPIMVRDPAAEVTLVYIDDVIAAFLSTIDPQSPVPNPRPATLSVAPSYTRTLGEITELIRQFHAEPATLSVPDQRDGFSKKLYATYLSYLPEDGFSYPLAMHCDPRGSFTEVLHTAERGQVSVNISKPGITKGQHWHHTKHEKFLVVSGRGLIQFRKMCGGGVIDYRVSGEKLEVVRIPPGYTHKIVNEGDTDMVTLMWANEVFDPAHPDTCREEV